MPPRQTWHYVVGDIHGCYDELVELESAIARHARYHDVDAHVVSVGDLVDRGPKSAQVVAHMREGVAAGTHSVIMGNHEQIMLRALWDLAPWGADDAPPLGRHHLRPLSSEPRGFERALSHDDYRQFRRFMWQGQGGYDTLLSWDLDPHDPSSWRLPPDDLRFLLELPLYWQNDSIVVTHALCPRVDLERLRMTRLDMPMPASLLEDVRASVNAALWNRAPLDGPPDPSRTHVSGHTPVERVKRAHARRVIQLDTACVYGGRLTAWCAEKDRYLRVEGGDYLF